MLQGYGVFGALLGNVAGQIVAGFLGLSIVYTLFYKPLEVKNYEQGFANTFKNMWTYSWSLSVSVAIASFLPQF